MGWRLGINFQLLKKRRVDHNADKGRTERGAIIGAILILAALCGLFFFLYSRPATNPDYEGTIVDRWADYVESREGSTPRWRLVVESQDGKRFTVKVDSTVYESARVGMRIKSRSGQIVLVDSEHSSGGK